MRRARARATACEHRLPRPLIRQPTRWEQWSACESQSSTWARTRSACSSPSRTAGTVLPVHEEREQLGLGEEVERYGYISAPKCAEAVEVARAQTRRARQLGCERIEILVTSPGRQSANSDEFADALARGTGVPVRILSSEEEGMLAWDGALAALERPARERAVCDIGGGSAQLVVGTLETGPAWVRSVDLGSLRLTHPAARRLRSALARRRLRRRGRRPPRRSRGSFRRSRRSAWRPAAPRGRCGASSARSTRAAWPRRSRSCRSSSARRSPSATTCRRRARRRCSRGAILFAEAQRRLGLPFELAGGGVREGSALALFRASAAAYA